MLSATRIVLPFLLTAVLLSGAALAPAAPPNRKDPLVARVNDHELHMSDVYASIESLSLGDQIDARSQLGTYIEALINEEVLFQWAMESQFETEPELRQEVKELVVRKLIEKHVRSKIEVTDADAKEYYDKHPSLVRGEHVRVRRILLSRRAQCEQLKSRITSEEEFIDAARRYSLDSETRSNGGDVGLMMRGENPPASYELEFFSMDVGEMRIFDVPQGCMLVRSVYYVNPPLPPFGAVRNDLLTYLRNRQEVQLVDQLFKQAIASAQVQRFYRESRATITVQRSEPPERLEPPAAAASAPAAQPAAPRADTAGGQTQ